MFAIPFTCSTSAITYYFRSDTPLGGFLGKECVVLFGRLLNLLRLLDSVIGKQKLKVDLSSCLRQVFPLHFFLSFCVCLVFMSGGGGGAVVAVRDGR